MSRIFTHLATIALALSVLPVTANERYVSTETTNLTGAGKTRAQVAAETKAAIAQGKVAYSDRHEVVTPQISSGLTRDQVRSEVLQSRKSLIGASERSM